MNHPQGRPPGSAIFNFPNQVTALRLLLAVAVFVMIDVAQRRTADAPAQSSRLYVLATVVFLLAAVTDWLDGFWARRYGQITKLGRIFDPFVDKVVVCGTFIFLVASPGSEVAPWMAVVVVMRELLVTALRSEVEQAGIDFSANLAGKLKMVLQCAAAATSLGLLGLAPSGHGAVTVRAVLVVLLWAAVAVTIYSGAGYLVSAVRLLRRG